MKNKHSVKIVGYVQKKLYVEFGISDVEVNADYVKFIYMLLSM